MWYNVLYMHYTTDIHNTNAKNINSISKNNKMTLQCGRGRYLHIWLKPKEESGRIRVV